MDPIFIIDVANVYENSTDDDQEFVQNLALFLTSFLAAHLKVTYPTQVILLDDDIDWFVLDHRTSTQYARALDQCTLLFNQDLQCGRPRDLQDLSRILGRTCKWKERRLRDQLYWCIGLTRYKSFSKKFVPCHNQNICLSSTLVWWAWIKDIVLVKHVMWMSCQVSVLSWLNVWSNQKRYVTNLIDCWMHVIDIKL